MVKRQRDISKEAAERNKRLLAFRKKNPQLTVEEIGQAFGISRVWTHKILKEAESQEGK